MAAESFFKRYQRAWNNDVQVRLTASLSVGLLVVTLIGIGVQIMHQDVVLRTTAERHARDISRVIAGVGSAALSDSLYRLQESLQQFRNDDTLLGIDIIDDDGLIVASQDDARIGTTLDDKELESRANPTAPVIEQTLPDGSPTLVILEPIRVKTVTMGWVRTVISLHRIQQERIRTMWWLVTGAVVFMLIGAYSIRFGIRQVSSHLRSVVAQLEKSTHSVESGLFMAGQPSVERDDRPNHAAHRGTFEQLVELVQETSSFLAAQSKALRDLTVSLEDKVKQRTAQLELAREQAVQSLEALRHSESALRNAQALAHFGSWEIHVDDHNQTVCSDEVYRILGIAPASTPLSLSELLTDRAHEDDRENVRRILGTALSQKTAWDFECRLLRPDQSVRWVHSVGHPILSESGTITKLVGTLLDITTRKMAETARSAAEGRLLRSRKEREALYHELQDGIIQSLYAVGLGLETASVLAASKPEESLRCLHRSAAQLQRIVQELRDAFPRLWPRGASKEDLHDALASVIDSFGVWPRPPFAIEVDSDVADHLSVEQELHILAFSREAIGNTLYHARAQTASVRIMAWQEYTRIEISDDGVGFDQATIDQGGEGFRIMAERAKKLDGQLQITSTPGNGTTVLLNVPPTVSKYSN